jgi:hypothetical protein
VDVGEEILPKMDEQHPSNPQENHQADWHLRKKNPPIKGDYTLCIFWL